MNEELDLSIGSVRLIKMISTNHLIVNYYNSSELNRSKPTNHKYSAD